MSSRVPDRQGLWDMLVAKPVVERMCPPMDQEQRVRAPLVRDRKKWK